jgi:hypothetical protein
MREFLELRVLEEHASALFTLQEGKNLGDSVRQVVLSTNDPRLPQIAELQKEYRRRKSFFFAGWEYHRRYSKEELASAECLKLEITAAFEPTGKECGTVVGFLCRHTAVVRSAR